MEQAELEKPTLAGDTIRFSAGPCFGACPSYSLRVTPDGSGLIEPQRFTAIPGPTRFTVTPAQYRRFRAALAQLRPAQGTVRRIGQGESCVRFATTMPEIGRAACRARGCQSGWNSIVGRIIT